MVVTAGLAARVAAQAILSDVLRKRRPLDAVADSVIGKANLPTRDIGFARAIAYETLRRFGQIDALIKKFIAKPPPPHRSGPTLEILMAGACELLFLNVPAHATVDAANRLAAADNKAMHFKPLINATLRRIAREGAALRNAQDSERLNTPDWLWRRWTEFYGEKTGRDIARAHLAPPPLDILGARDLADSPLAQTAQIMPGGALRLRDTGRIDTLAGFDEGQWWVQDFAASLPARLFGDVENKRVLDLCAAPGGKTAQLVSQGARVTAVEREPPRAAMLKSNLARLNLSADVVEIDLRDFTPDALAPCVLLDAPCSATGTIRRHPDLPWNKGAADIAACAAAAHELLESAAAMVARDGVLVFAVCSLEPEEGPEQIAHFLARHREFRRDAIAPMEIFGLAELLTPEGDLRTLPCYFSAEGGMDGFYAARLRRV